MVVAAVYSKGVSHSAQQRAVPALLDAREGARYDFWVHCGKGGVTSSHACFRSVK